MSAQAHTPTPWKVFTTPDGLKVVGIGDQEGGGICDAGFGVWSWKDAEGLANAALIVRAVNCHDELVDIVERFAAALGVDETLQGGERVGLTDRSRIDGPALNAALLYAKAVLQKARG